MNKSHYIPALPDDTGTDALLEQVQQHTFRYFWDFAHPVSGMARERGHRTKEPGPEVVTTGGTGFGIMAIITAAERKWITREEALLHFLKITGFLQTADRYHGIFPHWLHGATGRTIPFSPKDDGGDVVETSYLMKGLLCARQYFSGGGREEELRENINILWQAADWSWHTRGGLDLLYWHWSPNYGWDMNHEIRGWNECLITYVIAASSPHHGIGAGPYHECWAKSDHFRNGRTYYGIRLPLGFNYGGPLFFAHYSFLGLDPRGLRDRYADYWEQNKNHTLINRAHCIQNPHRFKNYGPLCWGLTASDSPSGYHAHAPDNDLGVITPSAALSSFPYTPAYSLQALEYFFRHVGERIWSEYGFTDAFSEEQKWYADSYLAIDQAPIVIMMENYRSGLLWRLFMSCPEIQAGLRRLGFESPWIN